MEHILDYRKLGRINFKIIGLHLLAGLPAILLLRDYFIPGIQIVLGLLIAPFIFRVKEQNVSSYRYGILSLIFIVLFIFLKVYVLLFMSAGCLILFSVELNSGKIGLLPFLLLICVSPAAYYVVNTFTFPLRLELSSCASLILNSAGFNVQNQGSYFIMPDGDHFSVDTACIGLNMFNTGLCIIILMTAFAEQKNAKNLPFHYTMLIFIIAALLLVFTNLMRIIALVVFKSEPQTVSHELIGISSLLLYTAAPSYFIINFLIKKSKPAPPIRDFGSEQIKNKNIIVILSAACFVTLSGWMVKKEIAQIIKDEKLAKLDLKGYSKMLRDDGVGEFRKKNALIYIKPASRGYESDHSPAFCWQGSGFRFDDIKEQQLGEFSIMKATLRRGNIVQYTAWWYDNGCDKTISQLKWRFSNGEPYRIINVTSSNQESLNKLCEEFLNEKLF